MRFESIAKSFRRRPEENDVENEAKNVPARLEDEKAEKIISEKIDIAGIEKELKEAELKLSGDYNEYNVSPFYKKEGVIKSLARLTLELRDRLPEYDTVLSDDASARLVSLLFRRLIDKKKDESGKEKVKTFFLAAGRHENKNMDEAVKRFISKEKGNLGKTLLITEFIDTGNSIEKLVKILEEEHVNFDLAALSVDEPPAYYDMHFVNHLYYGSVGEQGLGFYNQGDFSGVEKGKSGPHPVRYGRRLSLSNNIKEARSEVKLVADKLGELL